MPSGVCHGSAAAGVATSALLPPSNFSSAKEGMRVMLDSDLVIGRVQDLQRITALVKEAANASAFQGGAVGARLAGQIDVLRAGGGERFGGVGRFAGIALVRGAEAGKLRAGIRESFREVVVVSFNRFDTASLEQALGETRARIEIGAAPETGEEHLGPGAMPRKIIIAAIRQALEGVSDTMAGQRGVVGVDDREARRAQDRHLILGEMGEVAGADERVLAPCDIGLALGPDPGDLILD